MKRSYFPLISVTKLVCAILIVCIHTEPFSSINSRLNDIFVNGICRIAVPFFFAASGFLLFRQMESGAFSGRVGAYVKRLLQLYLFWSAIYFPFTALSIVASHDRSRALALLLTWFKNLIFTAGYGSLWYLPATVVAVIIVNFLLRHHVGPCALLCLGFLLYVLGLCGQSYFGLARQIPLPSGLISAVKAVYAVIGTTRNGVFEGTLFVAIGAVIAQRRKTHTKNRPWTAAGGFLLSLLLLLAEFLLVTQFGWRREDDMYLSLIPCACFLLKLTLCFEKDEPSPRAEVCRSYSSLIYFTHMLPAELYFLLTPFSETPSPVLFSLVLGTTLMLDTLILWAAKTPLLRGVRRLY